MHNIVELFFSWHSIHPFGYLLQCSISIQHPSCLSNALVQCLELLLFSVYLLPTYSIISNSDPYTHLSLLSFLLSSFVPTNTVIQSIHAPFPAYLTLLPCLLYRTNNIRRSHHPSPYHPSASSFILVTILPQPQLSHRTRTKWTKRREGRKKCPSILARSRSYWVYTA